MDSGLVLRLLERELDQPFHVVTTTDTVPVRASFAQLNRAPVITVHSVKARKRQWELGNVFGSLQHTEIPLEQCELLPDGVLLPQSIWGGYDEAVVTYDYGYAQVPEQIEQVITLLSEYTTDEPSAESVFQQLLRTDDIQRLIRPFHRVNAVRQIHARR